MWADRTLPTLRSYLNAVATAYGAGVERVPLLTEPDQVVRQIDSAISAATRGHIPKLLSPGQLNHIGWVLTDALYLHAAWARPFIPTETTTGSFTTTGGRDVTASYLNGGPAFRYARAGGWTAVRIPYRGGRLAMEALLPDSGSGGCPGLSASALRTISARLAAVRPPVVLHGRPGSPPPSRAAVRAAAAEPGWANIMLPKVSLSSSMTMNRLLSGLGMGVAFSGSADFAGLSPAACCIGFVQHAATLQVTAKGTVASAATAVGIIPLSASALPDIVFDRPYLLLVTDTRTGEPLFMARVINPLAG